MNTEPAVTPPAAEPDRDDQVPVPVLHTQSNDRPPPEHHAEQTGDVPATAIPVIRPVEEPRTDQVPLEHEPEVLTGPQRAMEQTGPIEDVPVAPPIDPWWTATTPTRNAPAPPPPTVPSSTTGSEQTPPQPPAQPPPPGPPRGPRSDRQGPPPGSPHPPTRRWVPWLVVGLVIVASLIGAAIVVPLMISAGTDVAEVGDADPAHPVGGDTGDEAPPPDDESGPTIPIPVTTDWTPTGKWCEAGDKLDIAMKGTAWVAAGSAQVGPEGLADGRLPDLRIEGYETANTASVVAAFPDHNDLKFDVGKGIVYTCELAGQLYLGINERSLDGNEGGFEAEIIEVPAQ